MSVKVNGVECGNVTRVVNHTTLACEAPPGAGGGLGVRVGVSGQWSFSDALFSYWAPVIGNVSGVGTGGGWITVSGRNFGSRGDLISVKVNGVECGNVTRVVNHTTLACMTEGSTDGTVDEVLVHVGGREGDVLIVLGCCRTQHPVSTMSRELIPTVDSSRSAGRALGSRARRCALGGRLVKGWCTWFHTP